VHNLSHSDFVVALQGKETGRSIMARPKFNEFFSVTNKIFEQCDWGEHDPNPSAQTPPQSAKSAIVPACYTSTVPQSTPTASPHATVLAPFGWEFASGQVSTY
jgi:hypothetical protein